jgi:hypothetical protein
VAATGRLVRRGDTSSLFEPSGPKVYCDLSLHGTFGRERRPFLSPADFNEVTRYGFVHPKLDGRAGGSATVSILFVGGQTIPPVPAHDDDGRTGQRSSFDLAECLG